MNDDQTSGTMLVQDSTIYVLAPHPDTGGSANRIWAYVQPGATQFGVTKVECAVTARRLAAAWNACRHLTTDYLERLAPAVVSGALVAAEFALRAAPSPAPAADLQPETK